MVRCLWLAREQARQAREQTTKLVAGWIFDWWLAPSLVAEAHIATRLADNVVGVRHDLDLLGVPEATARRARVHSHALAQRDE